MLITAARYVWTARHRYRSIGHWEQSHIARWIKSADYDIHLHPRRRFSNLSLSETWLYLLHKIVAIGKQGHQRRLAVIRRIITHSVRLAIVLIKAHSMRVYINVVNTRWFRRWVKHEKENCCITRVKLKQTISARLSRWAAPWGGCEQHLQEFSK